MDYQNLWESMKERLAFTERNGNMLQQTLSSTYLQIMNDLEQSAKNKEEDMRTMDELKGGNQDLQNT